VSTSIRVVAESNLRVIETVAAGYVSPGDNTVTFDQLSEDWDLTGASSVPVTKHADFDQALSGGAATIDLLTLPGRTPDEVISFTGLRVQFVKFKNPSTNANAITFAVGASNGWAGLGAGWTFTLNPGCSVLFYLDEDGPNVDATHKTIDLTGTLAQTAKVQLVAG